MNRNRAHAAYPKLPTVAPSEVPGAVGTCYACGMPVSWDGRRWLHTPAKGKR